MKDLWDTPLWTQCVAILAALAVGWALVRFVIF